MTAMGSGVARGHGFSASFVEHGYVIGLASVRADLNYQQGLGKVLVILIYQKTKCL